MSCVQIFDDVATAVRHMWPQGFDTRDLVSWLVTPVIDHHVPRAVLLRHTFQKCSIGLIADVHPDVPLSEGRDPWLDVDTDDRALAPEVPTKSTLTKAEHLRRQAT